MYPLILSLSDKMQSIYSEKANQNKHKERLTPDKSSQDGCIMLGVFYCSKKGHAIRRDSLQGFPNGRRRQAAGEAGTKCCPQKRGYHGHGTSGELAPDTHCQTSYFFLHTAASRGTAEFFYSTHFYLFPNKNTKRHMVFITGVPDTLPVRFFCALKRGHRPPFRDRAPPLRS